MHTGGKFTNLRSLCLGVPSCQSGLLDSLASRNVYVFVTWLPGKFSSTKTARWSAAHRRQVLWRRPGNAGLDWQYRLSGQAPAPANRHLSYPAKELYWLEMKSTRWLWSFSSWDAAYAYECTQRWWQPSTWKASVICSRTSVVEFHEEIGEKLNIICSIIFIKSYILVI